MLDEKANLLYEKLRAEGVSPKQDESMQRELDISPAHVLDGCSAGEDIPVERGLYSTDDFRALQGMSPPSPDYSMAIQTIDDLMDRDKQRNQDGFPEKIRWAKIVKPTRSGNRFVIVPTTQEEKLLHDPGPYNGGNEQESSSGSGEGEEGEVIGEAPIQPGVDGQGSGQGGQGEDEDHGLVTNPYDLGRLLTENFELPNVKDTAKKTSLTTYKYDLTDSNKRFGQILDKKATLKKIVESNLILGNIHDVNNVDPAELVVAPKDKVYKILSKERDFESQAVVFFARDYSGSMMGRPTEAILTQHIFIYSMLMYQFKERVIPRFVLHDTSAREVPDFDTYYRLSIAGGTMVSSAFELINHIVDDENLAKDYSIYILYGTDGEDWDAKGTKAVEAIKKTFDYVSRLGITIIESPYTSSHGSYVEKYINDSKMLNDYPHLIKLDTIRQSEISDARIIKGIKHLFSQK